METPPRTYPTFARELVRARAGLDVQQAVGLAIRADRLRRRMSQRVYAVHRGWSGSRVARLESGAGRLALDDVVDALETTPFVLALCRRAPGPGNGDPPGPGGGCPALPVPVPAGDWARSELIARVRGGGRRFPAHRRTRQVDTPPLWWMTSEATWVYGKPPHWYAPVRDVDAAGNVGYETVRAREEGMGHQGTEGREEGTPHETPGSAAA